MREENDGESTAGESSTDGTPPDGARPGDANSGGASRDTAAPLTLDVDPDADGKTAFMQALRVPRNARWGAAAGIAFTLVVFVFFVVIPGTYRSPLWYVGLGFVLALSTAGLVAFLLTLVRAIRLSRSL